jgi:hypothetical protein
MSDKHTGSFGHHVTLWSNRTSGQLLTALKKIGEDDLSDARILPHIGIWRPNINPIDIFSLVNFTDRSRILVRT